MGAYEYEIQRIVTFIILSIIGIYFSTRFGKRSTQNQSGSNIATIKKSDWTEGEFKLHEPDFYAKWIVKSGYKLSQKEIQKTKEIIGSEGEWKWTFAHFLARSGYKFSIEELFSIGNPRNASKTSVADLMAMAGYRFSFDEILELNEFSKSDKTVAQYMAEAGHIFTIDEIMKLDAIQGKGNGSIAQYMAECKYDFSFDDLLKLENPISSFKGSVAHILATNGHKFSLIELVQLGNKKDGYGRTIAHCMAIAGNFLPFDDLLQIGNSIDENGISIAHTMVLKSFHFTVDQILRLSNPRDRNGRKLAHYMVDIGNVFSVNDILALGDPEDHQGLKLSYLMMIKGSIFSDSEIEALGLEKCNYIYNDHITYDLQSHFFVQPHIVSIRCPYCKQTLPKNDVMPSIDAEISMNSGSNLMPGHNFTHLFLCKACTWWCIHESWTFYEFNNGTSDYLAFGTKSLFNYPVSDNWRNLIPPWLCALNADDLYKDPRPLTDDVISLLEY